MLFQALKLFDCLQSADSSVAPNFFFFFFHFHYMLFTYSLCAITFCFFFRNFEGAAFKELSQIQV
jgi:hypothetical protein